MKLLLQHIEQTLSASTSPAHQFVPSLFRAASSRGVTCLSCGSASAASAQRVDCYELEVNVRGCRTLGQSLGDYFAVEALSGCNAYQCDSAACRGAKRDAQLASRLHSAPVLLNVTLKRFLFDHRTAQRRKVTDKFAFPLTLDLRPYLTPGPGQDQAALQAAAGAACPYDLVAVVLHRGSAAVSGHYVAHCVGPDGLWHRFDDELVTCLGAHPLGDGKDTAAAAQKTKATPRAAPKGAPKGASKSAATGRKSASDAAAEDNDEVLIVDDQPQRPAAKRAARGADGAEAGARAAQAAAAEEVAAPGGAGAQPPLPPGHLSSSEAYLLVYQKRGDGATSSAADEPALPADLLAHVAACNAAFQERIAAATAALAEARACREARQREVREVLACAGPPGLDAPFRWVNAAWLQLWASGEAPPPEIDNAALLCAHGAADPARAAALGKRVSCEAWERLVSRHAGGPLLGEHSLCRACLRDMAAAERCGEERLGARAALRSQLQELLSGGDRAQPPPGDRGWVCINRWWAGRWCSWKGGAWPKGLGTGGPAEGLTCPHGSPAPGSAARRIAVPRSMWQALQEEALQGLTSKAAPPSAAAAQAHLSRPQLAQPPPFGAAECAACGSGAAASQEERRAQREALPWLAKGQGQPLRPGCAPLVALPAPFLLAWRAYVGPAVFGRPPAARPEALSCWPLPRCAPHRLLLASLPRPARAKGGRWEAPPPHPWGLDEGDASACAASQVAALALVTEEDAALLAVFYADPDGRCPAAEALPRVAVSAAAGAEGRGGVELSVVSAEDGVCGPCCALADAQALADALTYDQGLLVVTLKRLGAAAAAGEGEGEDGEGSEEGRTRVRDGSTAATALTVTSDEQARRAACDAAAAAARRASAALPSRRVARSRSGAAGGVAKLPCASTHSVWWLKLRILETFQVHPEDQQLFVDGARFDAGEREADEARTLAQAGVRRSAAVFCAAGCAHDPDDVAGLLAFGGGGAAAGRQAVERGFQGSLLLSAQQQQPGGAGAGSPEAIVIG